MLPFVVVFVPRFERLDRLFHALVRWFVLLHDLVCSSVSKFFGSADRLVTSFVPRFGSLDRLVRSLVCSMILVRWLNSAFDVSIDFSLKCYICFAELSPVASFGSRFSSFGSVSGVCLFHGVIWVAFSDVFLAVC